jgi:Cellulose binding domain
MALALGVILIAPRPSSTAAMTDCRPVPCGAPAVIEPTAGAGVTPSPSAARTSSPPTQAPASPSAPPASGTLPGALPATPASAAPQLPPVTITYAVIADWSGTLLGEFTVANDGSASITGWELSAAFPGDEIAVTWAPVEPDYGGDTIAMQAQPDWPAIPPGDSESGYFMAQGSTLIPPDCTFNGFACSDFPGPDQAQDQSPDQYQYQYQPAGYP